MVGRGHRSFGQWGSSGRGRKEGWAKLGFKQGTTVCRGVNWTSDWWGNDHSRKLGPGKVGASTNPGGCTTLARTSENGTGNASGTIRQGRSTGERQNSGNTDEKRGGNSNAQKDRTNKIKEINKPKNPNYYSQTVMICESILKTVKLNSTFEVFYNGD